MSPGEVMSALLLGIILIVLIAVLSLVLRRYKLVLGGIIILLIAVYIGYIAYSPTININTHAKKYDQLMTYLNERYPNEQFTVFPKDYESGHHVGQFNVNDVDTPQIGVTVKVDRKGNVEQQSYWEQSEYPSQEHLWKVLPTIILGEYTLDRTIPTVECLDYWTDGGQLTVFALMVDGEPAIGVFTYSHAGYGLLQYIVGQDVSKLTTEAEGYKISYDFDNSGTLHVIDSMK